jgi:hypothetical protein
MHTGSVARRELLKSKLPSAELGKIWRLADTDRKVPPAAHGSEVLSTDMYIKYTK